MAATADAMMDTAATMVVDRMEIGIAMVMTATAMVAMVATATGAIETQSHEPLMSVLMQFATGSTGIIATAILISGTPALTISPDAMTGSWAMRPVTAGGT